MKMRIIVFSALIMGVLHTAASAQIDSTISQIRMDYAVPDAPAFKALGVQPDEIMRPGTSQELAVTLANPFINSTIPAAFALECSPYLTIAGSRVTLKQYQESTLSRLLYRLRISIASERGETSAGMTRVAAGLRVTLLDGTDLRLDENYLDRIFFYNDSLLAVLSRIRDHFRPPGPVYKNLPPSVRDSIDSAVDDSFKVFKEGILDSIRTERERAIRNNWNKPILELGLAARGSSADSTKLAGAVADLYALWLVYAGNVGEWGQWVVGTNAGVRRNADGKLKAVDGSLGTRFYAGSNAYKFFLGADCFARQDLVARQLYQAGGEMKISILWVTLSAGIERIGRQPSRFTSNVDLKVGTP